MFSSIKLGVFIHVVLYVLDLRNNVRIFLMYTICLAEKQGGSGISISPMLGISNREGV
jgi:hypothetical protein